MPLGDVRTIHATQLVFVSILAWLVLKERFGFAEAQTTMVVLLGVAMITKPPFIFGMSNNEDSIVYDRTYYLVAVISLAGAFCRVRWPKVLKFQSNQAIFSSGHCFCVPEIPEECEPIHQ